MFFAFVWFLGLALLADWPARRAKGGLGFLLNGVAFFSGAFALVWLLIIAVATLWF